MLTRRRVTLSLLLAGVSSASWAQEDERNAQIRDEIVVTAQKRAENIQDVPAAISVLSHDEIRKLNLQRLEDYVGYVPGLASIDAGYPGRAQLTLRGVSTGPSDNATVGIHIDDAPIGSSSSAARGGGLALDLLPYDFERIEVLRGPQGTLYGASAMGGLLKYVTRKPDLREVSMQVGGEVSITDESGDIGWIARGAASIPLVQDVLAVRASAFRKKLSGVIDNTASGRADDDGGTQVGGRVALLWQPSDTLTIELAAMAQNTKGTGPGRTVVVNRATRQPEFGDLASSSLLDQFSDYKLRFYNGAIKLDLDWAALEAISSYSRTNVEAAVDASQVFAPFFGGTSQSHLRNFNRVGKFTQEIRLTSPIRGKFEWMLGGFYTDENTRAAQFGAVTSAAGVLMPGVNPVIYAVRPASYKEAAVFGNFTYYLTDSFDVTGGLRHSRNKQTFTTDAGGFLVNFPNGLPAAEITTDTGKSSEDVLTYMFNVRYRPAIGGMLYARIASGYRPGGPNPAFPDLPPSFDADRLVNYELGAKADFLDKRVSFDLALFYIDWNDIQLQLNTPTNIIYRANGGKAVSKGFEFSSSLAPVDGLKLGGNIAYTDARVKEDIPGLQAKDGDRVPTVPRWTASLTGAYSFAIDAKADGEVGFGYRHVGGVNYPFESNPTTYRLDAYSLLDAYASLTIDSLNVRLFARNLSNKRAYTSVLGGGGAGTVQLAVAQPRTIGISVDLDF